MNFYSSANFQQDHFGPHQNFDAHAAQFIQTPFSILAWDRIKFLYQRIKNHPFNQELSYGVLSMQTYKTYCSQDALYLDVYFYVMKKLSEKISNPYDKRIIVQFAHGSLDEKSPLADKIQQTCATKNYICFLNQAAHFRSPALIAAAVLPCFWIYYQLAKEMQNASAARMYGHPYQKWILQYSDPKYFQKVLYMIDFTNRLAAQFPECKYQMIELFNRASELELNFWDDAYYS